MKMNTGTPHWKTLEVDSGNLFSTITDWKKDSAICRKCQKFFIDNEESLCYDSASLKNSIKCRDRQTCKMACSKINQLMDSLSKQMPCE